MDDDSDDEADTSLNISRDFITAKKGQEEFSAAIAWTQPGTMIGRVFETGIGAADYYAKAYRIFGMEEKAWLYAKGHMAMLFVVFLGYC